MKGKNHLLLLLVTVVSLSSCKKFLEESTQDQLVPKTTRDYSEMLFGDGYPRIYDPLLLSTFVMDDDVSNATNSSFGQQPNFISQAQSILPVYSWQPDFFEQLYANPNAVGMKEHNAWYVLYSKISACNVALQNADAAVGTASDKEYLKGEAYTLRAFYYFYLVNLYGLPYNAAGSDRTKNPGVPIVLTSEYTGNRYKRNSVDEVYKQIVEDIEKGVALLDKEKRPTNIYRMNFKGAHLLASRIYLYMEQWDKVIQHASLALDAQNTLFQLNGWGAPNPGTKPIVDATSPEAFWAYGATNFLGLVKVGSGSSSGMYVPSADLTSQFASDDLRKTVYLKAATASSGYGFDMQKWPYLISPSAQPGAKIFRVSEAYLNRAEAYLQQFKAGNAASGQKGVDDLNTLRRSRINTATYVDWTVTTADQLLTDCRAERRRELFFEDHRWFDLRRYGMPSIEHIFYEGSIAKYKYTLQEKDPQYVLPIPNIVLQQNNALEQNPLAPARPGVAF